MCRHFWLHLARLETRTRFRRSRLGLVWAFLQPLLFTLLIALVLGAMFGSPMREFAPFVFSGLLVWGFIAEAVVSGCSSFIGAGSYMLQRRLPAAIYPLKSVLSSFTVFSCGFLGLVGWVLFLRPSNPRLPLASLFVSLPLLILLGWLLALLAGLVNLKFRDFQHSVGLVLQAIWFVSPVFIEPRLFRRANLDAVLDYNPVTHILNLVRAPLLNGTFPSLGDYAYTLGTIAVFGSVAVWRMRREESSIIFYL